MLPYVNAKDVPHVLPRLRDGRTAGHKTSTSICLGRSEHDMEAEAENTHFRPRRRLSSVASRLVQHDCAV